MKLIEPPLAEPHERWCERSEIPQSEEFPPTRLSAKFTRPVIARRSYLAGNITAETAERAMKMGNTKITSQLIGQNIRRIRLEHGETQQELGQLIGYGATTVANYESGYRMPDLETFLAIAIHYGASFEDFVKEQVHES